MTGRRMVSRVTGVIALGLVLALFSTRAADAAVTISRAEPTGGQLRIEGSAQQQQRTQDLSGANEYSKQRMRDEGNDHLIAEKLPRTTRACVLASTGRLTVDFDNGLGITTTGVKDSHCRIDRRGGGQQRFHNRARRMTIARLALAGFLLWPFAQFSALYLWHNGTLDGIVPALALATLESLGDLANQLLSAPIRTVLYLGFLAVLGRIEFRR